MCHIERREVDAGSCVGLSALLLVVQQGEMCWLIPASACVGRAGGGREVVCEGHSWCREGQDWVDGLEVGGGPQTSNYASLGPPAASSSL